MYAVIAISHIGFVLEMKIINVFMESNGNIIIKMEEHYWLEMKNRRKWMNLRYWKALNQKLKPRLNQQSPVNACTLQISVIECDTCITCKCEDSSFFGIRENQFHFHIFHFYFSIKSKDQWIHYHYHTIASAQFIIIIFNCIQRDSYKIFNRNSLYY